MPGDGTIGETEGTRGSEPGELRETRGVPTRALRDDDGTILRRLDVRADALDIRDRLYMPQLVQLPGKFPGDRWLRGVLPGYAAKFVEEQGDTKACTGFGLAAVIGYLLFAERSRNRASTDPLEDRGPRDEKVSPWMLYRLARLYDQWDGEERGGSSCRAAMKGWHKHGACRLELWPEYGKPREAAVGAPAFDRPAPVAPWQQDAARRPLGAYYRVNRNSVRDIQSAIHQVGAVFASARVHGGWRALDARRAVDGFPVIPAGRFSGGHAFALMGYNESGFLVQNSWGRRWGRDGFALLPYEDWSANAMDAWVAVLGAPVSVGLSGRGSSGGGGAVARGGYRLRAGDSLLSVNTRPGGAAVLSADGAAEVRAADESWTDVVTLAVGTEGRAKRQDINDLPVQQQYARRLVEWPEAAFEGGLPERLVLYFEGGLCDEAAAARRARAMASALHANGAYPLFYRCETGLREASRRIAEGVYRDAFGSPSGGELLDRLKAETSERLDRFVETYCRSGPPKSLWGELKLDAEKAAGTGHAAALRLVAEGLATLQKRRPGLEIHLAAHSAGAVAAGKLLHLMGRGRKRSAAKTLTLWAPACSLNFANSHFVAALEKGTLGAMHVDTLTDGLEQADEVAMAYSKSLLYLASRSLEDRHKEPLLGLAKAWRDLRRAREGDLSDPDNEWAAEPRKKDDKWVRDRELTLPSEFKTFADRWSQLGGAVTHREWAGPSVVEESGGEAVRTAARTHESFEEDVRVFDALLERVRGGRPAVPIGRLDF